MNNNPATPFFSDGEYLDRTAAQDRDKDGQAGQESAVGVGPDTKQGRAKPETVESLS